MFFSNFEIAYKIFFFYGVPLLGKIKLFLGEPVWILLDPRSLLFKWIGFLQNVQNLLERIFTSTPFHLQSKCPMIDIRILSNMNIIFRVFAKLVRSLRFLSVLTFEIVEFKSGAGPVGFGRPKSRFILKWSENKNISFQVGTDLIWAYFVQAKCTFIVLYFTINSLNALYSWLISSFCKICIMHVDF